MPQSPATPDPALESLLLRIIGKHRDLLGTRTRDDRERIVNAAAARNTLRSGGTVKALRDAYIGAIREYAAAVTAEALDIVRSPDGAIPAESSNWIRAQLETNFELLAGGLR